MPAKRLKTQVSATEKLFWSSKAVCCKIKGCPLVARHCCWGASQGFNARRFSPNDRDVLIDADGKIVANSLPAPHFFAKLEQIVGRIGP